MKGPNLSGQIMEWSMKIQRRSSNERAKPQSKRDATPPRTDKKLSANAGGDPFTLKIKIESPPLVAFGPPEDSSGALLSGILELYPRAPTNESDKTFDIAKLELKLVTEIATRRPVGYNCHNCTYRTKELQNWVFIPSQRTLTYNNGIPHGFPFSFLIPGNLPATTFSSLTSIKYALIAEATPVSQPTVPVSTAPGIARPPSPKRGESPKVVTLTQPLRLSRCIFPPIEPKTYNRIFLPTPITTSLTFPNVIYPGATDNEMEMHFSGLNVPKTHLRWALRKITWRIDEIAKANSSGCALHASKVEGKDSKLSHHTESRIVGAGEMKNGWKHDASAGKVTCLLHIGTNLQAMAACNVVEDTYGIRVSHALVIECIVAEEMLHTAIGPARKGGQHQPTGKAHVLRMSFPIIVTDRGGMGISWDEEIPPRYEDVAWNSPPTFVQSEGSADAEGRRSMDGLQEIEGIRMPTSGSHGNSMAPRPSSSGSSTIDSQLARTESNTSSFSN